MVLQNSELVSSDDSETGGDPKIKKGHIRVAWHPTGAEEVVPERKVGLADRSLMPGDVVRRMIKGKDTQRGYCRHMEVTASIQIVGTRHIINGVNSKDLEPIEVCVDKVEIHSVNVRWQCRAYSKDGAGTEKEQPKAYVTGDDIERLKLLSVFEPCTLQVGDRHFYTIKPNDVIATREQWRREQKKLIMKSNQNSPVRVKSKRSNNVANVAQPADKSKAEVENGLLLTLPNRDCDGQSDNNEDASCDCNTSSDNESETASQASSTASGVSVSGGRRTPSLPVRTLSIDGSVQEGIPSTELYPIHHLDDQEFFPGDFVIENNEDACMRVYGVVQSVDHAGRTAAVKWFKTYASQDCPRPTLLMENEVSVYDLKDHPDFQYRPGIVVIRVANFQGEDEACTAGQVLDNYPEGRKPGRCLQRKSETEIGGEHRKSPNRDVSTGGNLHAESIPPNNRGYAEVARSLQRLQASVIICHSYWYISIIDNFCTFWCIISRNNVPMQSARNIFFYNTPSNFHLLRILFTN
ncbi:unnamed protein product [Nesidiocoris tenuis]|uniref:Uncharacterized protein n=1 Tax=Nesidiocoris tenuis TaxID=355587 RepID=A0A6H5H5Z2_9HEMI|nr:unnamed protein product [Nesidiocoris tenuis]